MIPNAVLILENLGYFTLTEHLTMHCSTRISYQSEGPEYTEAHAIRDVR